MITGIGIMFHSCTKDDANLIDNQTSALEMRDDKANVFSPDDSIKETILGEKAPCNPYTVEIVTQAWNNLYPDKAVSTVAPTDIYVKFKPSSEEQVYELYKDPDLTLWDFPLDHKVIQMGDYYFQPGKGENDIPDLYCVVDKEYPLASKGVVYEQLAQLVEVPYMSKLSEETYRLCNIDHVEIKEPELGGPMPNPDCLPGDPNWPDCLTGDPDDPDNPVNPDGPPDDSETCKCYVWQYGTLIDTKIIELEDGKTCSDYNQAEDEYGVSVICDEEPPEPPSYINSCDCPTFTSKRKPAGCVKVQSPTGDDYVGVKKAKVIVKNHPFFNYNLTDFFGFFWTKTAYTDEYGCWKINKECYGKIWVWVQFKNEMAYIRGHQGFNIRPFIPVTDYVGEVSGPDFSDIQVQYSRWTTEGTQTQRYWCAATTINAVEDMHNMCNDEGINEPPHLDIYLAKDETGAAWMAHYGGVNNNIYAELLNSSILEAEGQATGYPSSFLLPDIFLDRNEPVRRYRGVAFHEMSHASHFTNVGSEWWQHLTKFEFEHEGHGGPNDNTDTDAGYCAVAESWADHLGELFDANVAGILPPNENLILEANGWIPEGIYFDLFDTGIEPTATGIIDNVSGFTNFMIFNTLDANTTEIEHIRTRLWNANSNSQGVNATQANYSNLFNSYGY